MLKDYHGTTDLQAASSYGYLPMVRKLLIEDHKDVNYFGQDQLKQSPLHYAANAKNDPTNVAKLLNKNGAAINAKDYDENTPLHLAAASGNAGIVKLLIENGAIIDAQNKYGNTPLMETIKPNVSHTDIANLLIDNGADINAQEDDMGYTPLHYAAWASSTDMVKILIDEGAKVDITDNWGQTALDIAKRGGLAGTDGIENIKPELIKKIESKGVITKDDKNDEVDYYETTTYSDGSVQPKPLFWFRSDTETKTQIGRCFWLIP